LLAAIVVVVNPNLVLERISTTLKEKEVGSPLLLVYR
jgi:hypothetical protein